MTTLHGPALLPPDIAEKFETAFERAIEKRSARDYTVTKTKPIGQSRGYQMELLLYDDGSFDMIAPVSTYHRDWAILDSQTPEQAIQDTLEGPAVVNALGGNTSWNGHVTSPAGNEFIIKHGVRGLHVIDDHRNLNALNIDSYVDTLAAGFLSGNADLHAENIIVTRDEEYVLVDHDQAEVLHKNHYHSKKGVPDEIWTRTRDTISTKANKILSGALSLPDEISNRRQHIVSKTARNA